MEAFEGFNEIWGVRKLRDGIYSHKFKLAHVQDGKVDHILEFTPEVRVETFTFDFYTGERQIFEIIAN